MKLPVVRVEWVDSSVDGSPWVDLADAKKNAGNVTCYSVGFLVHETDDAVLLSGSYHLDDEGKEISRVGGPWAIPRVAVVELKRVKA